MNHEDNKDVSRMNGTTYAFRPVMLVVDDDPEALKRVERELRKRYGADYQLSRENSAEAGLRRLAELKASGEDVALMLADQRMPRMEGIEFLSRAHRVFPLAKRLLLIDPMDTISFEDASRAMVLGRIDYVEYKTAAFPNERFHGVVTDFLREWTGPYYSEANAVVRIVGERGLPRSHETRDLLVRYAVPHAFYSADSEEGRALLQRAGQSAERLPVWVLFDGRVLVDPSHREFADAFGGTRSRPAREDFDVVVVGGANSAGQAALHLSKYASRVTLVVRGGSLEAGMSAYLTKEIEAAENIRVRRNTRVTGGGDEGRLERLTLQDSLSGHTETVASAALFVLIGAEPRTEWLPSEIERDEKGFVLTGQDLLREGHSPPGWRVPPYGLRGERARGVCCRGREASFGETGRLGRRRGLHRHPIDP